MPRVTFVSSTGIEKEVDGDVGQSVMEIAKRNDVTEIVAECGGSCACATCHVYVDISWMERAGPPSADEADMLEFVSDRRAQSRLSCQIRLRSALDGLIVHTPAHQ